MNYSKELLIKNIDFYVKSNNLKISDIEKECGVSQGYFSRFKQSSEDASPNISILISISSILNVPLNSLLFQDCSTINKVERTIIDFLGKLIEETFLDSIRWSEAQIPINSNDISPCIICLFENNDGYFRYNSLFNSMRILNSDSEIFYYIRNNDTYAFCNVYDHNQEFDSKTYELYLIKDNIPHKIVETDYEYNVVISNELELLYNHILLERNRVRIDDVTIKSITEF